VGGLVLIGIGLKYRGFPKTSVFGKSTSDLREKAGFKPLFPKPFLKLTEFWERLDIVRASVHGLGSAPVRFGYRRQSKESITSSKTFYFYGLLNS
jgi:hypothetical protein